MYVTIGALSYAGGVFYASTTDGTVHAFDEKTGTELASLTTGVTAGGVAIADGKLQVAAPAQPAPWRSNRAAKPTERAAVATRTTRRVCEAGSLGSNDEGAGAACVADAHGKFGTSP